MSDRTCVRYPTCYIRNEHYASCPDYSREPEEATCRGCAPYPCRDGSLICDKCFGRMRALLRDIFDLRGRVLSSIDPLSAKPIDQIRVQSTQAEPPAAVRADPLDALPVLDEVLRMWSEWNQDLSAISNNQAAAVWMGENVLDRHPADDGIRSAWSVQDAMDQWGAERRTKDTYVYPTEEDGEEVIAPVYEWYDPTLTLKQAAERVGVGQRAVQKWVAAEVLIPRMKVRGPRGSVTSMFYASEVDAAAELMKTRRNTGRRVAVE